MNLEELDYLFEQISAVDSSVQCLGLRQSLSIGMEKRGRRWKRY